MYWWLLYLTVGLATIFGPLLLPEPWTFWQKALVAAPLFAITQAILDRSILYYIYNYSTHHDWPTINYISLLRNIGIAEQHNAPQKTMHEKLGGLVRFVICWPIRQEAFFVADPQVLKEMLVTKGYEFEKPYKLRSFLAVFLGNGLICAEGDVHRRQKRSLLPVFSYARIKDLVPTLYDTVTEMCDIWTDQIYKSQEKREVFEVYSWLSRTTLDMIGKAGFNFEFDAIKHPENPMVDLYNEVFIHQATRPQGQMIFVLSLGLGKWIMKLPFPANYKVAEFKKVIRKSVVDLISQAKTMKGKDLLSVILRESEESTMKGNEPMSEDEMIGQVMTFLAAGHETTSTATMWALWLLAKPQHKHIQDELRAEVKKLLPEIGTRSPTFDELENCRFLNNVVKETLRLVPPVPITLRENQKDTTLGGLFVKKGTRFFISPAMINRNPVYWGEDAEEFNPHRWDTLPEDHSVYSYMTFLVGRNNCIGAKFAQIEMKLLLACMIDRFRFEPKYVSDVISRPMFTSVVVTRPRTEKMDLKVSFV